MTKDKQFVTGLILSLSIGSVFAAESVEPVAGASTGLMASPLEQSFKNPPASAQAWCFWWWLNGKASKEGITRDFEEMKKQGISGALLFDADTGGEAVPPGPVFMGVEWRELFKFALSEADRLGITLTANICRTWNAGGPWVTPEHGVKKFTYSASQFKVKGSQQSTLNIDE
jgi:hypothetical protein